jgi:major membrane immunogen (membrane-anchored lipoprotein)
MTNEYVSTMKTNENVEFKGVTLLQKEDGTYAVPGGGYVVKRGDAERAAKGLYKSHKGIQSPISQLADKTVERLTAASREGVDLVLGA